MTAGAGGTMTDGTGGAGIGGARGTGGAPGAGGRLGTGGAGTGGAAGLGGTSGGAGGSAAALIENDTFWKDTAGTPIYSQGGGILKVGATYYWYGVKYNGAVTYAATPTKLNSDTSFAAVTCYSSTNLVTWKFESNVLTKGAAGSTLDPSWLGRLGVVYNANTKKYVLISQYQGPAGTGEL